MSGLPRAASPSSDGGRRELRRLLREERRSLDAAERAAAERLLARHLLRLGVFGWAHRIAIYLAFDGEPDLRHVVRLAEARGKRLYVPVLLPKRRLRFAPFEPDAPLARNRLGILEPERSETLLEARALDLVLTPLIAFDDRGVRLGIGGGYYDRSFQYQIHCAGWSKPKLIGIGYELQHRPRIEAQPWDVRLWGAVTEAAAYRF